MAPHSSTLAWKIPWTEEPGGLQSMGSLGVGHNWATSLWLFTFMHWRRKWQPTPVFLPGESQGRGCLVGCHLWSRTESDMTEATQQQQQQQHTVNSRMNSGSWWWTGRPGCCDSWGCKESDTHERLKWTELNYGYYAANIFMFLFAICIILETCPFQSFIHFLTCLFYYWAIRTHMCHIHKSLSDIRFTNILSISKLLFSCQCPLKHNILQKLIEYTFNN